MKKFCFTLLLLLGLSSWGQAQRLEPPYSFFVAGHTYGSPFTFGYGLHPPFVDMIPWINEYPGMEMGFLTGDIAYYNTADYIDSAIVDMQKIAVLVRPTPGNHDVGATWYERFGELFYSFMYKEDLYIVLCPVCGFRWKIEGEQLDFLEHALREQGPQARRIFVMMHELIWWTPDQQFSDVVINHPAGWPGPNNYWEVVEPLFRSTGKETYLFAGDLGATNVCTPYHYHRSGKMHYIGSGMGGGARDNMIVVDVRRGSVNLNLIALGQGDPHALGDLVSTREKMIPHPLSLFYSPGSESLQVLLSGEGKANLELLNLSGQILKEQEIALGRPGTLEVSGLPPSVYLVRVSGPSGQFSKKVAITGR